MVSMTGPTPSIWEMSNERTREMRTLLIAALILAAGPASAASLRSASAYVADGERLECLLRNVGKKNLKDVSTGSLLRTVAQSVANPILAPGDSLISGVTNTSGSVDEGWCEFNFKGSKRSGRASLCLRPASGATCTSLIRVK